MNTILALIAGLLAGGAFGLLLEKSRRNKIQTRMEVLKAQLDSEMQHRQEIEKSLQPRLEAVRIEEERRYGQALSEKEIYHQKLVHALEEKHREAMSSQQARFDEMMEKIKAQVQTATDQMLKARQKEFAESSTSNLGLIVKPLRETMDRMHKAMEENTLRQTDISSQMKANIENMLRHTDAAKNSADELARVFKHESKVQGDWGETVLDELLRSQGLTEGIHYRTQPVMRDREGQIIRSEEGRTMRPDVILHLDTKRDVIIDSKVSLTAFMNYVNADSEEDRSRYLRQHVDSIRKHVKELSAKDYSSYIPSANSRIDYVIMFVPHVMALWTAINAQPDLWREAMDRNVYIADEQTLYAALKITRMMWTQIEQSKNHEEVFRLADEILKRAGMLTEAISGIKKGLDEAGKAYEEVEKKLDSRGQTLINSCAKLQRLGAKQDSRHPIPALTDIDDIPLIESSNP